MCLLQIWGRIQLLCYGTLIPKALYGDSVAVPGNYIVIKIIAHVLLFFDTVIYWASCLKVLAKSFNSNIICAPALCTLCRKGSLKGTCNRGDDVCC